MADGVLLTIAPADFKTFLDQLKQNFTDGLNIVTAVETALGEAPPAPAIPAPTIVTPGSGSTVGPGGTWSLRADALILLNGTPAYKGWQSNKLVGLNGAIYIYGMNGSWYVWNGTDFVLSINPGV